MPPFLLILHWKVWWNVRLSQWKARPFATHLMCVSSCFWRLGSVGVKMAPHVGTFSLEKHCCSQCSIDAKMFSWIGTKLCAADTGWHFLMVRCASFRRSLWFCNRDLFWVLFTAWNQALIGQFEIIFWRLWLAIVARHLFWIMRCLLQADPLNSKVLSSVEHGFLLNLFKQSSEA